MKSVEGINNGFRITTNLSERSNSKGVVSQYHEITHTGEWIRFNSIVGETGRHSKLITSDYVKTVDIDIISVYRGSGRDNSIDMSISLNSIKYLECIVYNNVNDCRDIDTLYKEVYTCMTKIVQEYNELLNTPNRRIL